MLYNFLKHKRIKADNDTVNAFEKFLNEHDTACSNFFDLVEFGVDNLTTTVTSPGIAGNIRYANSDGCFVCEDETKTLGLVLFK